MQAGRGRGQGRRTRGAENVPLVGSHGSGHACASPSRGSAALCAAACHGRGRGRRISPRMGVRVTDSGPKASPLQGPAAAEGGICHERGRGRRSCHRTHRGRNRTPREAARGGRDAPFPRRHLLPRKVLRQPERLHVSLGRFRGTLRAGVPWEGPRETDLAAYGGKGDGFGAESVPLAGPRGSGGRGVPAARVVSS